MSGEQKLKDLAGFPMVMSVSEAAINRQMDRVHKAGLGQADQFPNVPWKMSDEDWDLTVEEFSAPQIDFDTPLNNGCRLIMKVIKGHFSIWTVKHRKAVETKTSLDGMVIYVTTPMKQVQHKNYTQSLLTVQSLFVDLSGMRSVELDTRKTREFNLGGTATVALKQLIFDRFKKLGEDDPKALMFGLIAIPTLPVTKGRLAPTALHYTVSKSMKDGKYAGGCLNYLLSTEDSPAPANSDAVGVFNKPLLRPEADATLVISEAELLDTVARSLISHQFKDMKLEAFRGDTDDAIKLYMVDDEYGFGVTLNGRGRSAYVRSIDSTVVDGKIKIQYVVKTSVYQLAKDIDITVEAFRLITVKLENEKLKVDVSKPTTVHYDEDSGSFFEDFDRLCEFALWEQDQAVFTPVLNAINLPGNAVWKFSDIKLDGNLYITASYE